MKSFQLQSGQSIPAIGLGTWKMEGNTAYEAVKLALEIGYRHIDCAAIYSNEAEVGRAFKESFSNGINRDDVWVTSKLWNDSHKAEHVRPALEKTLSDLQLECLDLYLIHWPVVIKHGKMLPDSGSDFVPLAEVPIMETWQALERCVEAGLVKHIGVSNFNQRRLQDILDNGSIKPATNQVECHPFLPQDDLLSYCQSNSIQTVAYSPLGSGDRPDRMKAETDPSLFESAALNELAAAKGISLGQLLLAWSANRNVVAIPKSTNEGRLRENLAAGEIELTSEEIAAIDNNGTDHRFVHGKFFELPGSPYKAEELWN